MELVVFSTKILKKIEAEMELVVFSTKMLKRIEVEMRIIGTKRKRNWSSFQQKC
jgi:hypothetical protein